MTVKTSKSNRITADQKLIDGIKKHLSGVSLMVLGQTLTDVQSVAVLQARIDAANNSIAVRAALQSAVKAERTEVANTKTVVAALRKAILIMFGDNADTLSDFGLVPPKKRTMPTVAKKTAAVKRAKATRAARHTMGKKQKAQIHGEVATTPTIEQPTQMPQKPPNA